MRVSVRRKSNSVLTNARIAIFVDKRYVVTLAQQKERIFIFHRPLKIYVQWGILKSPDIELTKSESLEVDINYRGLWFLLLLVLFIKLLYIYTFFRMLIIFSIVGYGYYLKKHFLVLKKK
jgi:hypothetical protein